MNEVQVVYQFEDTFFAQLTSGLQQLVGKSEDASRSKIHELLTWNVQDGAIVQEGDSLGEVSTDLADFEILSPATGVIKIVIKKGISFLEGEVLANIVT
jgi:hypothetical protein